MQELRFTHELRHGLKVIHGLEQKHRHCKTMSADASFKPWRQRDDMVLEPRRWRGDLPQSQVVVMVFGGSSKRGL